MPVADQFYALAFNELAGFSVGENQKLVVAVLPCPRYCPNLWVIGAQVQDDFADPGRQVANDFVVTLPPFLQSVATASCHKVVNEHETL